MNSFGSHAFPLTSSFARRGRARASRSLTLLRDAPIGLWLLVFCVAHIPIAVVLFRYNQLATFHAAATLLVGLGYAVAGRRKLLQVAFVGAYITGAEVLWRMCNAQVFWEFGKYATAAIFIVAIFRSGMSNGPKLILGYFALLLPSAAITLTNMDLSDARGYLSFNLSGPFALAVSVWFFSQLKLSKSHFLRVLLVLISPVLGIAAAAFFALRSVSDLSFTDESNYASSGGFGPNQVSAALGLGAFAALIFLLIGRTDAKKRIAVFVFGLFMAAQSALTFSRGGLYNAAGATLIAGAFLIRSKRTRLNFVIVGAVLFVSVNYFLLPRLQSYTEGALVSRFQSLDTTNRLQIIFDELELFTDNPIAGVGPGGSRRVGVATAHTEFARLPAEHGLFGISALALLLILAIRNFRRPHSIEGKAVVASMMGWSFLFMLNAAMRLVAPAFAFGLAFGESFADTSEELKVSVSSRAERELRGRRRPQIRMQTENSTRLNASSSRNKSSGINRPYLKRSRSMTQQRDRSAEPHQTGKA